MDQKPYRAGKPAAVPLGQLKKINVPPLRQLLGPMLSEGSIGMIAGSRGAGKSLLGGTIAVAVAGEKPVEPWGTGSGDTVCYFDGEMRLQAFRDRLAAVQARITSPEAAAAVDRNLFVVSRDFCGAPIGSIDTEDGQQQLEDLIPPSTSLVIIDNLSAWTKGGREDGASWAITKSWLIKLRLKGIAVLLIHHTGKNGNQRGSSAHEDLLDYSILLRPVADHVDVNKTRFIVQHTKLRDHIPELKQDFEFAFWNENEKLRFDVTPVGAQLSPRETAILQLHETEPDLSQADIAERLGISKSTVSRVLKKWAADANRKGHAADGQDDDGEVGNENDEAS
ncbi:MarR family transcriptional regulator [Herbaspirillum sp. HC18]|nr:MarR family transcriptional regulator [Herbaspirillum sp. HC18]